MSVPKSREPVFTLPPYKVEQIFTTYSETMDWGLSLLSIPRVWKVTKGKGIKVAVLDTGCALQHPDLKKAVIKSKSFVRCKSGVNDIAGHGSHVAGIIAARENSSGVIGVAPECDLLIAKVLNDNQSAAVESIAAGIVWAVKSGARIISMSLGSSLGHPKLEKAVRDAAAAGVFIICSAGNEGPGLDTVGYPALYDDTIAVGAIDQKKKIGRFSSRGKAVDIVAPGVEILSCFPPRNLAKLTGTSMACPFVTGIVALMLAKDEVYGTKHPIKTHADLLARLKESATDLGSKGFDTSFGWGLLDPTALLAMDSGTAHIFEPEDFSAAGRAKLQSAFKGMPQRVSVQVA